MLINFFDPILNIESLICNGAFLQVLDLLWLTMCHFNLKTNWKKRRIGGGMAICKIPKCHPVLEESSPTVPSVATLQEWQPDCLVNWDLENHSPCFDSIWAFYLLHILFVFSFTAICSLQALFTKALFLKLLFLQHFCVHFPLLSGM